MEKPMTDSVLVAEHPAGGRVVGQLTLNVEKTLNSLTREMVDIITDRLEATAPASEARSKSRVSRSASQSAQALSARPRWTTPSR